MQNNSLVTEWSNFQACAILTSVTPVYIIRMADSVMPIRTELHHVGYPYIPNYNHHNECSCPLLLQDNNMPALTFTLICLPRELRREYPQDPRFTVSASQHLAGLKHTNTSLTYYSPISFCGTTLPRLINRTSYGNLAREAPAQSIENIDKKGIGFYSVITQQILFWKEVL